MPIIARKTPLTDRDAFVEMIAIGANGHTGSIADAVTAMWTVLDIQRMATRTGRPADYLMAERAAARMRLLKAIGAYRPGDR